MNRQSKVILEDYITLICEMQLSGLISFVDTHKLTLIDNHCRLNLKGHEMRSAVCVIEAIYPRVSPADSCTLPSESLRRRSK